MSNLPSSQTYYFVGGPWDGEVREIILPAPQEMKVDEVISLTLGRYRRNSGLLAYIWDEWDNEEGPVN